MPNSNQILDRPQPKNGPKIRKSYCWIFELLIVGYHLFLVLFISTISFSFPSIQGNSFLGTFFLCLLQLLLMFLMFLCGLMLAVPFIVCTSIIFYRWHKASSKYDQSFEAPTILVFKDLLDTDKSPITLLATMGLFVLFIVAALFLWSEFEGATILSDIFLATSLVYVIISSLYLHLIKNAVHRVLPIL